MALIGSILTLSRGVVGAVGFCTRLPVGHRPEDWEAFRGTPAAMVIVAYPLGAVAAAPLVVGLPVETAAFLFPVWLYVLTGITHLDGLADLGDAAAVHADAARRREVMRDSSVGVGALAVVVPVVLGLALAASALAGGGWQLPVAVVITAEVGAKAGVVGAVALGDPTHEGLGSALAGETGAGTLVAAVAFAVPLVGLVALSLASAAVVAATAGGGLLGAVLVFGWARRYLGGVSGDVFGAINEVARVLALHAGVVAWTL